MASSSSDKSLKTRHKPKQSEGEWMYFSLNPSDDDCSKGKIQQVIHGRFYITGQLELNVPNVNYQSDSADSGQATRIKDQEVRGSEESWQKLQPVVECGDNAMTLTVWRRRAVQLQLDRVNESPLPLSQLPSECGYSVQTTWRDLSLMVQYDACHVTQEDGRYVLPLLWRGTPVKISCPVSQIQPESTGPSSLCCSPYGMTVKVQGPSATEELRVNVRGEWMPLVVLAEQCGYTLNRQAAEIVITAPFLSCGITIKDGKHTFSLQIGQKTFTLTCPVSPHEEFSQTQQPLVDISRYQTRELTEPSPESQEPSPWVPPFYLAPLYYPHPIYHHKNPRPYVRDAYDPPTPLSSTPDPTFSPQPLPDSQDYSPQIPVSQSYKHFSAHGSLSSTNEMEDSSQVYPDLQEKPGAPVSSLSERRSATEVLSIQPPSHAFNPYYHYYHHPKIPLPGLAQNPDPSREVPEDLISTNSHNSGFPVLPISVQESDINSDQFPQPVSDNISHPLPTSSTFLHKGPESHASYPPHPHFYSSPYFTRDKAERVEPVLPDIAAKTNVSNIHTLPHKYNMNPYSHQQNEVNNEKNSPDLIKQPLFSEEEDIKPELDDKKRHTAPVTPPPRSYPPEPDPVAVPPEQPSFNYNLPPYPHYFYPNHYYYYGPGTTTPLTKSLYDDQNSPLNPYYYYNHLYYQPKVTVDNQELHPAGVTDSGKASSESQLPSDSDYSRMDLLAPADQEGYLSIPQLLYGPFNIFYSHYVSLQYPCDPSGHPSGDKDLLEATTPSASPCSLGSMSDFDCSNPLGCCSYFVKDCTVGQHFVFVVPDSVLEPTVAPPAHPSKDRVSCTLEKLTSDPNTYIVPLDGCGVSRHVFGHTVVHLLEIHGIYSHQQDHTSVHETTPVRLMVECSSSPGSPGEVRLYVMDQPPPPPVQPTRAASTVHLRIATDRTFTSYHPEAHLPLSLIRGRPLYLEVRLLDPPEPDLVLLVHSCMAYTQAPHSSWMPVYDGCPSSGDPQLLPSAHSDSHHIRRIIVSSFLSLPSESPSKEGSPHLEDPEIYFFCLTEVCSAADVDCIVSCINSPNL